MAASSSVESKMYTASYSRDNAAILLWSYSPPRVASAGGGWPQLGRRPAGKSHYFLTANELSRSGGSGQLGGSANLGVDCGHGRIPHTLAHCPDARRRRPGT